MARIPLSACIALALTAPCARADKFHFGSAAADQKLHAGARDVVSGVLLREEDGLYIIRVAGGEVGVPKAMVYKVEKDDLTLAAIEREEQDQAQRLKTVNARRQAAEAAEATAREEARRQAAEAVLEAEKAHQAAEARQDLTIHIDFDGTLPDYMFTAYDAVIHRADPNWLAKRIEDLVRRELDARRAQEARLRRRAH
jgi:hypothetical protein